MAASIDQTESVKNEVEGIIGIENLLDQILPTNSGIGFA
jgi:hypothetical protein